jgi:hypothetical protein
MTARNDPDAAEPPMICRFVMLLPEPLPFPTELFYFGSVRDGEPRLDDPLVICRFHQHEGPGPLEVAMSALSAGWLAARNLPETAPMPVDNLWTTSRFTIAEAFTSFDSPDDRGAAVRARQLGPRQDPFMRCLRFVDHWARAYRLASYAPTGKVTYERVLPLVFAARVPGTMPTTIDDAACEELLAKPWDDKNELMWLEHTNMAGVAPADVSPSVAEATMGWERALYHGLPLAIWRERRHDAVNALVRDGDLGLAISHAHTAGEVLLDGTLTMLLWEEQLTPQAAAELFDDSVVRRCQTRLAPRLRGNWHADRAGPVKSWVDDCVKPRGRVVHGGYEPHYGEAQTAIDALSQLERHVFDRLAEERNTYKRTVLLTLGEEGLARRDMWKGKIRRFHEGPARTEPTWNVQLSAWTRELVEARLVTVGR